MDQPLKEHITELLSKVVAPGDTANLVEAERLNTVIVENGHIGIILDFADSAPMNVEKFRAELEQQIRSVENVSDVNVILTGKKGSKPRPKKEAPSLSRDTPTPPPPTPLPIPGVKHIIAVASGKGGVGKSTTSINLALALRDAGQKVGLLDADIFGPSLPHLVGADQRPEVKDGKIIPIKAFGLTLMSIGFLIDVNQPVVWRGPRVMGATSQMLHEVLWGELDTLVVDMPPGTGDVQLTMVQRAPLSGVVIVSTPQDLALIDAQKGIAMFEKVSVPILGIIENMSQFICPHCGEKSDIFDHGGARETAKKLGKPFLGEIPLTLSIRQDSDSGCPTVENAPTSPEALIYKNIARKLIDQTEAIVAQAL